MKIKKKMGRRKYKTYSLGKNTKKKTPRLLLEESLKLLRNSALNKENLDLH